MEKVGLAIGGTLIAIHWILVIGFMLQDNVWGHKNYWNEDVGTLLIISILLVATAAWAVIVWRHWVRP